MGKKGCCKITAQHIWKGPRDTLAQVQGSQLLRLKVGGLLGQMHAMSFILSLLLLFVPFETFFSI